eukprot:scaffold106650_cov42-Prasinocladus_malaysianus.AAC.1
MSKPLLHPLSTDTAIIFPQTVTRQKVTLWAAVSDNVAGLLVAIYSFVFLWFVGGLLVFHTFLMITNQTTYEHFRSNGGAAGRINPYDNGCLSNCSQALCIQHESLLDVSPEDYLTSAALQEKRDIGEELDQGKAGLDYLH